jgi:hypothetical protein
LDYLDWDRKGFPYPLIPFQVNCYGEDMRMPALGANEWIGRLPDRSEVDKILSKGGVLPPQAPLVWRCYDLGKAVAEIIAASPYRACIIGSSSWSHASLTDLHGFLWGDVESDREHYEQLKAGRFASGEIWIPINFVHRDNTRCEIGSAWQVLWKGGKRKF